MYLFNELIYTYIRGSLNMNTVRSIVIQWLHRKYLPRIQVHNTLYVSVIPWKQQLRFYADYPTHVKVQFPTLSSTVETSTIVSWFKKEGDKLNKGDLLAKIKTEEETIIFETPDEGYLAKIIVPAGTKNVCTGKLICIIVPDKDSVAAFKDFEDSPSSIVPVPRTIASTLPSVQKKPIMSFFVAAGAFVIFLFWSVIFSIKDIFKSLIPLKYKMKSIDGEIILVTGGAGGIGKLICLMLANLGAIVVVWDINKAGMEETVKLARTAGGTCYGYVCDLCDKEDIYKKAELVKKEVGKVTILINNAGVGRRFKFLDVTDKLLKRTIDVNVMSHFWMTKAFLPSMLEDNKGHIVSIASLAGFVGVPYFVDYCTSKFAIIGFEEALHMELIADGYDINMTVICPFFISSTGMYSEVCPKFLPRLLPNKVADRVVTALRCNEKLVIIPGYIRFLVATKWFFPWSSVVMFVQNLFKNTTNTPNITSRKKKKITPRTKDPDT
ncbi:epidermal retinol dehydrogenase 2 [Apis mellifera]|uniref:Short-chain dehydrogenase/reductase 3 n=1 Tax=Apis mellifera TaxID=7460 RepID=A0A7M7IL26_APIME|nr:epidermal retinol dehydrogenase 2 [Apis mellifera]|eukprot:XP_016770623.2 epidermal retinol dehydrogenase 2 [Apis mellifera]